MGLSLCYYFGCLSLLLAVKNKIRVFLKKQILKKKKIVYLYCVFDFWVFSFEVFFFSTVNAGKRKIKKIQIL